MNTNLDGSMPAWLTQTAVSAAETRAIPVCTRERTLRIFRITGLTKVFGIYETLDQALAVKKGRR